VALDMSYAAIADFVADIASMNGVAFIPIPVLRSSLASIDARSTREAAP